MGLRVTVGGKVKPRGGATAKASARQATKAGGIRSRRSRKAGAEDETRDGD